MAVQSLQASWPLLLLLLKFLLLLTKLFAVVGVLLPLLELLLFFFVVVVVVLYCCFVDIDVVVLVYMNVWRLLIRWFAKWLLLLFPQERHVTVFVDFILTAPCK